MSKHWIKNCIICGIQIVPTSMCLFTGKARCENKECHDKAEEFSDKKHEILKSFAKEKEMLLVPLQAKLEMDLFLNERKYFHDDSDSQEETPDSGRGAEL